MQTNHAATSARPVDPIPPTTPGNARPPGSQATAPSPSPMADVELDLTRVRRLAHWLDSRFTLPGTSIRFGFDTLLGLLPVVGDTATAAVGLFPVVTAVKLGVRKRVVAHMLFNLGADWAIGLVPGVDLVLDTAFKANLRNARLLEKELVARSAASTRPGRGGRGQA